MCAKTAPRLIVTPAYKSPNKLATIGGMIIAKEVFKPSESASPQYKVFNFIDDFQV